MSDSLSSENAKEQGEQDYDTLEEYIFQTQRDHEKETGKSIRFREWQEMQLSIIKNKLGTNAVEVVARSYLMGLSRLRDSHHEEVEDVSEMLTEFLIVIGKDPRNEESFHHVGGSMNRFEIEEPSSVKGELGEPRRYQVRESALSEVENNYVHDAFFGPWIHRYVAALGFLDSEMVTEMTEDKLSSFSSSVSNSMDEARDEIESMIMDYISMSQGHWINEGMRQDVYESMWDVVELMDTERKETCEQLLERAEDLVQDPENNDNE